jgi:hypothetical protein
VQVSNSGKQPIGSANATWTLSLVSPEGSKLRIVGPVSSTPENGVVAGTSVDKNKVQLNLRFFQPRASVALRLLVLNAEDPRVRSTASLAGIPLDETTLSPEERKRSRLALPFFFLFLIVLTTASVVESRSKARNQEPKPSVGTYIALIAVGSLVFAFGSASGVAWFLDWFD